LAFIEPVQTGAFDGTNVDEHVLAPVIRLDETETLLAVEPLNGSFGRHLLYFQSEWSWRRLTAAGYDRVLGEGRQTSALSRRGRFVRPKLER